ncbi:retrotransposon protein, putative, ty1-copia subclass [Tanacetum coccineum]
MTFEQPIPPAPAADSAVNVLAKWNAVYDAHNEVACLILGSMTPELHRQFKNSSPYEMLQELKSMFKKQAGVESVGLILNGLTSDFARFVRNYNMHNMGKTIGELHALLIEYEKGLPKKAVIPQVMAIQGGRIQKANKKSQNAKGKGKGKGKGKDKSYVPKPKNPKPNAKEHPAKNDACHHCKEVGHWKRNCPVYLAELMKNKKQVGTASSSGCVVSVSRLVENGFVQCFTDYGISVSRNNVLYFNAIPSNGIYEIDMSNSVPNVNSISNKRVKHNLDSTYLWHCRLAHISKKRIEKLQHDEHIKVNR